MTQHTDTIVALSSPPGSGALGIIRISGDKSIEIVNSIFEGKDLSSVPSHTLHFGRIKHEGELIDEVVVGLFKNPRSYTGEDILEISCHGSAYVIQKIIQTLVFRGARPALPGEFTLKAFLNGKMDLSQAEAVADLIAAETSAAHKIALQQLKGGFSSELKQMRDELITFASLLELELDFSEEDVEFANRQQLASILDKLDRTLFDLIKSFELGNVMRKGIPVAIAGKPNAGKSTLLNRLLNEERAIVSAIPGTTRDTLEESLNIDGIPFRLIDTAGLRETNDEIESIGVQRALEKMKQASLILYLFDADVMNREALRSVQEELEREMPGVSILLVGNKADQHEIEALEKRYEDVGTIVWISAKENQNIDLLKTEISRLADFERLNSGELIINNARHLEALQKSRASIASTKGLMAGSGNSELLAFEIKQALHYLGEITGEVTTDDLLDSIFRNFCIGK